MEKELASVDSQQLEPRQQKDTDGLFCIGHDYS